MRFPEFEGEWEETTLGNSSQSLDYGMNATAISFDGENKYIRITDIDDNSSKYNSHSPVSPKGKLTSKFLVEENDILFARTGASTGKTYLYDIGDGKLYFAGFLIRAKINNSNNSYFIFSQTKTKAYKKWVKLMSMRSGQPGINSQEYAGFKFKTTSKEEQNKIAAFLLLIDQRINTQIKIIEGLESLSKTLKDRLFSQEIKYPEFKKEWKKYKVTDLLEFFSTNSLAWEQLSYKPGNYYNLHYGLIHQGAPTLIDMTEYTLPSIKEKSNPYKYTLCKDGDIIFADASEDTNDVAKAVEFVNCNEKNIVCGLHTIHGRDKLSLTITSFKGYLFTSKSFRNQIRNLAQGTKVFSISPKTFNECFVDIPSKEEQSKISNMLSLIDKKINVEKLLLSHYEFQKKYLLQQMFI